MDVKLLEREIKITDFLTAKMADCYEKVKDDIGKYPTQRDWDDAGVTRVDQAMRVRFWEYLNQAVDKGTKISIHRLVDGVLTRAGFYDLLNNPVRCAYLFTKPQNFMVENIILLDKAKDRIEQILDLPIFDEKGKPIGAVITAKIKMFSLLSDRVHGKSIERIQQHQMIEQKKTETPKTMKEIEAELKSLQSGSVEVIETIPVAQEIETQQDSQKSE